MKLLYSGLPGTGKTTKLIEHYLELRTEKLNNNGYFIVPTAEHAERITRLVLARKNPLFNKRILTLDQLLSQLVKQKEISAIEQQYILKEIVKELPLKYFSKVLQHNAFYQQLARLINELKEYSSTVLANSSPKKNELKLILENYNRYLHENNLIDHVDKYQLAVEVLKDKKFDYILIDGFSSFNSRQQELIVALNNSSQHLIATLLDLPNYLAQKEFYLSLGLTQESLSKIKRTPQKDLQFLAQNFLTADNNTTAIAAENINLLVTNNRITEIEQIAREILLIKNKQNLNWSDFTLIFRQIGDYKTLIYDIFEDYNIPVTIHEGLYTQKNSFVAWLLQLLKLSINNYPKEELLAVLKGGFYEIDRQQIDQLAIAALRKAVFDQKENWLQLSQEISATLYKKLTAFFELTEELAAQTSYEHLHHLIEKLINKLEVMEKLQNLIKARELLTTIKDISKSYRAFLKLLTELAGCQKNFAAKDYAELIGDLEHYLTQNIISVKERQGNQVQVYDMPLARQKEYRIVFIPNLTTRTTPLHQHEDLLLKDAERADTLKKSAEKQQEEIMIFYQTLCRATEKIYFSYPQSELSGTKLEASHFLKQVLALFDEKTVQQKTINQTESIPDIQNCFTEKELRTSLLFNLYKNFNEEEIIELLTQYPDLKIISDIVSRKKELRDFDCYSKETQELLKNINNLAVKDLEVFSRCRFNFFCKSILKVFDQAEISLAIPTGEIIHDTLQAYFKNEQRTEILTVFAELFSPQKIKEKFSFLQQKQINIELEHLKEKLLIFIENDREIQERRKQYKPLFFELAVEEHYSELTLNGVIDRIDVHEQQALIIDYKTGLLPEINTQTIKEGILPQIWLYAMILEKKRELTMAGCEYLQVPKYQRAGIYLDLEKDALQTKQKKNILSRQELDELIKTSKRFLISYISDLRVGKFYERQDQCSDYCNYKNICRMKKDNELN